MFNVNIDNNEYAVYGENEFTFAGNLNTPVLSIPSYFNLELLNGNNIAFKLTNNTQILVDYNKLISENYFQNSLDIKFSAIYPLKIEEYETLYELHKFQIEENPTEEFKLQNQMKNDIKKAKKLVKTSKDC